MGLRPTREFTRKQVESQQETHAQVSSLSIAVLYMIAVFITTKYKINTVVSLLSYVSQHNFMS